MAGVKGRSGRRPRSVAEARFAVIDKAWQIVRDALNDETLPKSQKIEIAERIVQRDIARKINVKGEGFGDKYMQIFAGLDEERVRSLITHLRERVGETGSVMVGRERLLPHQDEARVNNTVEAKLGTEEVSSDNQEATS